MIKNLKLDITGNDRLLMHSARLSDPLDPIVRDIKKISAKRQKSEEDYRELAKLEFIGGLYYKPETGPYIPGENIFRALVDGAKKRKLGVKVTSGLFVTSDENQLLYEGPRDVEGLWDAQIFRHAASVKVGTSRVTRTRPIFSNWKVSADLNMDTEVLDLDDLRQVVGISGALVGLGDWRPRFGRFSGVVSEVKD